jgi:hypothetical protein
MNQNGQRRSSRHPVVRLQAEVYHFRFLFAIKKFTGERGKWGLWMVATAAQNGRQGGAKSRAQVASSGVAPRVGSGFSDEV